MLLRLLLIASALPPLSQVGNTFWSTTFHAAASDTLTPVTACAPTQPDDDDENDENESTGSLL